MKKSSALLTVLLVAMLIVLVAALSAFYAEFAAEYTDATKRGVHSAPFFAKRQWEEDVVVGTCQQLVLFEIPECRHSLFARLHPLRLMRAPAAESTGLHMIGTTTTTGNQLLCASGISVSSFYFWSCHHGSANFMNRASWVSMRNSAFLRESGIDALARDILHPLLAPISFFGSTSSFDLLMLSHRSPLQTLPYFVHFLSRRVLCAAHGAIQVHFVSWSEARRVVVPSECALPPTVFGNGNGNGDDDDGGAWVFSAHCNLRKRVRMRHAVVREGQMLLIPPATVYTVEHLPSEASSCAVVLQCDFATLANRCKNRLFTPRQVSGAVVADADEEETENARAAVIVGDVQLAEVLSKGK